MNRENPNQYKFLHPRASVIFLLVITTIILLIYSLGFATALAPVKYFSYLYSTYSLIVVTLNIKRFGGFMKDKIGNHSIFLNIKNRLYKIEYIHRYFEDKRFKNFVNLYFSVAVNAVFIFIKLREGILYQSVWFISFAIYYMLLTLIKFFLLRRFRKSNDLAYEYKVYRSVGCFLMLLNLVLTGIIIQTIVKNVATVYKGNVIYASALYSFYLIITAIVNVIKYKKYHSPILSSVKVINLFTACVSILMLQTTMIATFSSENDGCMRLMNTITGTCEVILILIISTYMIINGTNKVHRNEEQETN